MSNFLSINRQKIKAEKSVKNLVAEYERKNGGKFQDGVRLIDISKTKDNVILKSAPKNIDLWRQKRIDQVNNARKQRQTGDKRCLRSDTVDLFMSVVQPSADFINGLRRDEQIQFFKDCLDVMNQSRETYGETVGAVIHFDEKTPHMQVLSSTIDTTELKSKAKEMMGNKKQMSQDQTLFVQYVQSKGWAVERGINRVTDKDYRNWKDEKQKSGAVVNRYTENQLLEADQKAKQILGGAEAQKRALTAQNDKLKAEIQKNEQTHSEGLKIVSKVSELKRDVFDLEAEKSVLQAQNSALQAQNDDLNIKLAKDKQKAENERKTILQRAKEMMSQAQEFARSVAERLRLVEDRERKADERQRKQDEREAKFEKMADLFAQKVMLRFEVQELKTYVQNELIPISEIEDVDNSLVMASDKELEFIDVAKMEREQREAFIRQKLAEDYGYTETVSGQELEL